MMSLFITLFCLNLPLFSIPADQIRQHYEWGEYEQLITVLQPLLANQPDTLSRKMRARYYNYLGVALFGTGHVSEAQQAFLSALETDSTVSADPEYMSEEISTVYAAIKINFYRKLHDKHSRDSLLAVKQKAFEENLKALKQQELHKNKRNGTILSVSLLAVSAAIAGVSAYEYYSTKGSYSEFRKAAQNGDKLTYDRLRPSIRRSNLIVFGCAVTAGISAASGITISIRTLLLK